MATMAGLGLEGDMMHSYAAAMEYQHNLQSREAAAMALGGGFEGGLGRQAPTAAQFANDPGSQWARMAAAGGDRTMPNYGGADSAAAGEAAAKAASYEFPTSGSFVATPYGEGGAPSYDAMQLSAMQQMQQQQQQSDSIAATPPHSAPNGILPAPVESGESRAQFTCAPPVTQAEAEALAADNEALRMQVAQLQSENEALQERVGQEI
eukprot:gnl/TRDRNA2_/TRDRNA2_133795_c1_seq1.p1 gnl/TRDRNA2_/TRDRNA2_133795_c1~~gnl/TRDRNA2_/TRDRNA2_133795_c1_seq1.p1  ORF type:complete len:208 (-),score=57.90 gnl/TRDRNA2_/TRDRNA2_133795_c1_seq1:220-843(-)